VTTLAGHGRRFGRCERFDRERFESCDICVGVVRGKKGEQVG